MDAAQEEALLDYNDDLYADLDKSPLIEIRSLDDYSFWSRFIMAVRRRLISPSATLNTRATSVPNPRSKTPSRSFTTLLRSPFRIVLYFLAFFGLVHIVNVGIGFSTWFWDDDATDFFRHFQRTGDIRDGVFHYTPDLTRDVLPVPCHSHNDYFRKVPLYEAIYYGCTGVEADVWLMDDDLLVGHNEESLTQQKTFRSMYVDPIADILDYQNPSNAHSTNTTLNGIFDREPRQALTLLVDFKNDGKSIFPYVQLQLERLRTKNYLTFFDGEKIIPGLVTVVATGNAPFDLLAANRTYRDIFFDAPLAAMSPVDKDAPPTKDKKIIPQTGQGTVGTESVDSADAFSSTNSYYASVSLQKSIGIVWGRLSKRQIELIRAHVKGAHLHGLKARYWNTPNWPISIRNHVWEVLIREGVDYLNVDDLKAASRVDWSRRKHKSFVI